MYQCILQVLTMFAMYCSAEAIFLYLFQPRRVRPAHALIATVGVGLLCVGIYLQLDLVVTLLKMATKG